MTGAGGGGISLFAAGAPVIEFNVISGNSAQQGGGIWLVNQSDANIVGNVIVRNNTLTDVYVTSGHDTEIRLTIEALVDLRLRGGGHGAERSPMKRLRECEHFVALRTIGGGSMLAEATGGLDEAVVGFRAGVREEHLAG